MNCFEVLLSRLGFARHLSEERSALIRLALTLAAELDPETSGPPAEAALAFLRSRVGEQDPAYRAIAQMLHTNGITQ